MKIEIENKVFKWFGLAFASMLLTVFCALLFAVFTMLLWNWLMPMLFGLPEVTFIQAWGINFLTGILFRSTNTIKEK